MADQRTLHLGGAEPVAGDLDDVVGPADDPEVPVLVALGGVANAGKALAAKGAEYLEKAAKEPKAEKLASGLVYVPVKEGTDGSASGTSQMMRIRRLRAWLRRFTTTSNRSGVTPAGQCRTPSAR